MLLNSSYLLLVLQFLTPFELTAHHDSSLMPGSQLLLLLTSLKAKNELQNINAVCFKKHIDISYDICTK